jgi:hypothetical protein
VRSPFWFYGDDDGTWEQVGRPLLAWRRSGYDWELAPAMAAENGHRNFSVEGATETHEGFRHALKEIIGQFPELRSWAIKFDGPWLPVTGMLGPSGFDWASWPFLHGTATVALLRISQQGLCPRTVTGMPAAYGTRAHAGAGRPDLLYLTTQLGMARFAARDAAKAHGGTPLVLTVGGLDRRLVRPDEDAGESQARASLDRLGSIGYAGCVPPDHLRPTWMLRGNEWERVD